MRAAIVCRNCQSDLPSTKMGERLCSAQGFNYCDPVPALIAAAPEMLAALRCAADTLEEIISQPGQGHALRRQAYSIVMDTIAKAEGRAK